MGWVMKSIKSGLRCAHLRALCILLFLVFVPRGRAQAPVFEIIPVQSWIKFHVKSSVTIAGKFDKWGATAHRGRITHRQLASGKSAVWACQHSGLGWVFVLQWAICRIWRFTSNALFGNNQARTTPRSWLQHAQKKPQGHSPP